MIVRAIKADRIPDVWPVVKDMLNKAVKYCHGETTIDHVYDDLVGDFTKLLVAEDEGQIIAACVLTMHQHPAKKICQISFVGGDRLDEWCDASMPVVEKIAREAGADALYIQGRRGWARRLKNIGFNEYATLTVKELR